MSDGLTDRIAAALYRAVGPKQIAWDEVSESSRQVFYGMAAAVVEELGLEKVAPEPGKHWWRTRMFSDEPAKPLI